MQDIFSSIISSSELPDPARGKPYPDMLITLLEEYNLLPSESIMVGDAKGDVLMAQAAGVLPIVVLTGQLTHEEATRLGVQHVISDVSVLQPLISSL
jgi:phosphoglycolate phosphatase-like HAD superfamily hydrolase